jgi:prevent-host-death family protein
MTKLSAAKARQQFSEVMNKVAYAKDRHIITKNNKPVAAIIAVEDLELLERIEDGQDIQDARKALARAKKEGTVSWDEVKKSLKK